MKKYFSFIMMAMLMALPLVFAGCSSDDDDDENGGEGGNGKIESVANLSGSQIVGTWRCINSDHTITVNGTIVEEAKDVEVGAIIVITQTGDNTGLMVSTYQDHEDTTMWKIENGQLYITDEEEDFWHPFHVTELTSTRMTMIGNAVEQYGSEKYEVYSKVVLERVK
ncbi:MAG: hypothetical protein Q4C43_10345 [Prevotella sp.]|nr:hypothetical protein [Prevotella sp.]MDO4933997.1 hypothetical protein [Prevotella sp.]